MRSGGLFFNVLVVFNRVLVLQDEKFSSLVAQKCEYITLKCSKC